jgi:CBS domain-containing protein
MLQRTAVFCFPATARRKVAGHNAAATDRPNGRRQGHPTGKDFAMTIASILKHKGSDIAHVLPDATVAEVAHVLSSRRIGAVLVCCPRLELLGILSERDIVHALADHGASALDLHADQLMTRHVTTALSKTTVAEAMSMMTSGRFRHLPVMEQGRLVGLVSIGDVVKARLGQQEQEVDSLKAYVSGA